jgi:hypothetical protein
VSTLFCRFSRLHLAAALALLCAPDLRAQRILRWRLSSRSPFNDLLRSAGLAVICLLSLSQASAAATATSTALIVTSAGNKVTSVPTGTVVALTATVTTSLSAGTPVTPGLVKFCDTAAAHCEDSALLGTAQLTTAGTATFKFRPGIGNHTYSAIFAGTGSYTKSTSSAVALTVTGLYPTATTIASSGSPGNYTLTATVVGLGSRTVGPMGEVSFLDTTNGNALLGTGVLGATTLGQNFMTGPTSGVGSGPRSVAVGDFNGDGILDMAVANLGDNTVTVLLGKGDGSFTVKSTPEVGNSPFSIVTGDFNGDGIPDLATANQADNTVTVLLGKGDGTFLTQAAFDVGRTPKSIAVGDFNSDGILDLATANLDDSTVTILLGKGDGTFTTKSTPSGGFEPSSVAVGDFNGDGIPDLALADSGASSVTVLLGNGDGTFTLKSAPDVDNSPFAVAVGDFNGDGIPDLATANPGYINSVTVLLGNGDGTFTVKSTPAVGNTPLSIAVGDFNGDGIPDLATANFSDNTVTVLLGKGDGTFTIQLSPSVGNEPASVAIGDFNGDGIPDIAVVNSSDNSVVPLLSQITETAIADVSHISVLGSELHQVVASYPGDTNHNPSLSNTVPLLGAKIATALTLSSTPNPSIYGDQILLTATLSPYSAESLTTAGETVTFYYGGKSIATSTLSSGVATVGIAYLPIGIDKLTAVYAGDSNFISATSPPFTQTVNIRSGSIPGFLVTVNTDTTSGVPSNCTSVGASNCSLRDALAAAAASGGNIAFSSTVFNTPQTIALGGAGTLNIPSNTTITGPATSSRVGFANLVTVNGNGQPTVILVVTGATNTVISGLNVTGGIISGGFLIGGGGGILNNGTLTLVNSTIAGNSTFDNNGGGISNNGTLTLVNSTIANNFAGLSNMFNQGECFGGGGIWNSGQLTITSSNITQNNTYDCDFNGSGILNQGSLTITNSIVADNINTVSGAPGPAEDDCDGASCPTNGSGGNIVGAGLSQPFPSHPAICGGIIADIPRGLTTDQRGIPRTTTYSTSTGNVTCVDSGAIQSHYGLSFSTEPPASVEAGTNFGAVVQVTESGFPVAPGNANLIPLALGAGDSGSLSGGSATTNGAGQAIYSNLSVSAPGSTDKLIATMTVTTTPPPAPLTQPLKVNTTSSAFQVTQAQQMVMIDTAPEGLLVSVDGAPARAAPLSVNWTVGSRHTITTTSPQSAPGSQFTFTSWSDSGAISHMVTASASVTSYTATFATSYQLTILAHPTAGGTVTPTSGGYYAAGTSVNIGAQPNSGYIFTSWTTTTDAIIGNTQTPTTDVTMSAPESVTANFQSIPSYRVTVPSDDAGNGANCTDQNLPGAKPDANCSLRDALTAAQSVYYPCVLNCQPINITFDTTVFSTPQTITVSLPLFIPSNTTIVGPSTGSGTNRTNLVTVSAGNGVSPSVFQIPYQSQVANAVISGITITGGNADMGGGISNGGALTVIDCTISGNSTFGNPNTGAGGGGIYNDVPGVLTIINSTISGNSAPTGFVGGIYNAAGDPVLSPGGGTLTIINSTISNNNGGNLYNGGTLATYDSVVDDCSTLGVTSCPATGTNGNVVGNSMLAPLANYGGPTQTMPPLPGSPAICAGDGIYTQQDQRGFPRPANYNGKPCYDSGAVQTNYSLLFSTAPPANVGTNVSFTSAVQLDESGAPFPVNGVSIPLALGAGNNGTLSGGTASTNASGVATYAKLSVSAAGINDTLVATLPLTTTPPPSPLTAPISVSATSTSFDVGSQTITLTLSVAPSNPVYGTLVTLTGTISPAPAGATSSLFSFLIDLNTANSVTVPAAAYHNGTVTATYGQFHAGAHTVALSFSGTADYAAATSASVPVNVQQETPTITWSPAGTIGYGTNAAALLDATANTPGSFSYTAQAAGGRTIALTAATVLPVGSYTLTANFTPTDTVDYKAATRSAMLTVVKATLTVSANNATRVYGTENPVFTGTVTGAINGDTFTETFATAATINSDAGTYAIVPSASGSNLADYAVTAKNGTLTVTPAASAMMVASSTPNSNLNESVTFTATVRSSTTGTPAGSVEFLNGSTVLGNSMLNTQGVATYTTSALAAGTQTIDSVYAGSVDVLGSQAMLSQKVTAPGFSLSANPTSLSLNQGETGQIKITLTPTGGYNGSLTFDCTGLPELAACSFNPATLMADGSNTAVSTTMTLTTAGSNHGTVSQNDPDTPASRSAPMLLCWLPASLLGFTLCWKRKRLSPAAKRVLWMTALVASISGIVACGSSPSTPTGSSTITVTAKGSGNSSQSVTVMVTVNK